MIAVLMILSLLLCTSTKLVSASNVRVLKYQRPQQEHYKLRHDFSTNNQVRELLPWDISFVKGSSKVIYNEKTKQISFNFTRTAIREDVAVTISERGCNNPVYPIPGDDDKSIIANIEVITGDEIPNTNDVSFKVIVELDKDVHQTPLFYVHDDGVATIDFCLHIDLTTTEIDHINDVPMNFANVEYRMKLLMDTNTNRYEHLSSFTGKKAMSTEL